MSQRLRGAPPVPPSPAAPSSAPPFPASASSSASVPHGVPADPVHDLLVRHLPLCETAVDPLEIAAELEAAGIGPGTAGRYRHSDVFSLAEELYARVPRRPSALRVPPPESPWRRRAGPSLGIGLLYLLPCAALWLARSTGGAARGPGVALTVAGLLALVAAVGSGQGRGRGPEHPFLARLGFALGLAGLLGLGVTGGLALPVATALACSVGAADWCARWFRHIGWGHLGAARSQSEFRERMRPVLPVALFLYLTALSVLTFAAVVIKRDRGATGVAAAVGGADGTVWAAQECAGAVLLLVLLLWRCGRRQDALAALLGVLAAVGVAAAAVGAAAPWRVPAAGGPAGTAFAEALLWGCGPTAVLLLPYAWTVLLRPESHHAAATE
ncbi:hypothetical protein [Streptacidiphilus cavernicola]|uniref:Integral membrane protein n=1 Tax=Streptacidiphilus cavernicola TaxID=3342716 RepID=A0ABV6VUE9_9ACTN